MLADVWQFLQLPADFHGLTMKQQIDKGPQSPKGHPKKQGIGKGAANPCSKGKVVSYIGPYSGPYLATLFCSVGCPVL